MYEWKLISWELLVPLKTITIGFGTFPYCSSHSDLWICANIIFFVKIYLFFIHSEIWHFFWRHFIGSVHSLFFIVIFSHPFAHLNSLNDSRRGKLKQCESLLEDVLLSCLFLDSSGPLLRPGCGRLGLGMGYSNPKYFL